MKYLKKDDFILPVTELYAYRYDCGKGKTVLRIKCSALVSFEAIRSFFSGTADYDYYEGEDGAETKKCAYLQYGADLDIHYRQPLSEINADNSVSETEACYEIEVLRDPSIEASVHNLYIENAALKDQAERLKSENAFLSKRTDETELLLADALFGNTYPSDIVSNTNSISGLEDRTADLEFLMAELLFGGAADS